ncbi:GNAT family N-acetyltransferase [Alkalibacterium psychrotolerans]
MIIRNYETKDEKEWVYTKALSYLFSPLFDDMSKEKDTFDEEVYQSTIELVAVEEGKIVGLLDIGIYVKDISQSYTYYQADKVAYFANLAVHPDHQNKGVASELFKKVKERLLEERVNALAIFTRDGDSANHLYKKWGGKVVSTDYLIIGTPKDTSDFRFGFDAENKRLKFVDADGANEIPYYLREGTYIVSKKENLDLFEVETVHEEITYIKEFNLQTV